MNKKIIIIFSILGVILLFLILNKSNGGSSNSSNSTTLSKKLDTMTSNKSYKPQEKSFGLVDIEITPSHITNGDPIKFDVSLNTHSIELDYDFKEIATLTDDNRNTYEVKNWDGGSGGHHLRGTLEFEDLKTSASKLSLELSGIDGEDNTYTWQLIDTEATANTASFTNISSTELSEMLTQKDFSLVDVHIPEQKHIPGSDAFIPFNEIDKITQEFPNKNEKIVLYCRSGSMSQTAADALVKKGYTNVINLSGGLNAWQSEGYDVVDDIEATTSSWLQSGSFEFDKLEHDFGVVKQSDGKVNTKFKVRYVGDESVEVTGLPTSCACTSAELSQTTFNPGDEAELTVTFNANLHPEPKERFFRTVSFNTEPKQSTSAEVKIWINHIEDLGPDKYEIPVHED